MSLPTNQVVCGNCLEVLKTFPPESIDFVQTSPPYWGLRVYGKETEMEWPDGWKGQLGLEPHPMQYIEHLVLICREIKRVLKKTGSMYIVLGDTFAGSHCGKGDKRPHPNKQRKQFLYEKPTPQAEKFEESWLRPKQQLNIPFHVAFALQQDGWIQRDRAIWHKPNAMPGSQKDRLTCSYEFIFHFVKNDVTCLWRNMESGEWRSSRPVQQYVKEVGALRVVTSERPAILRKRIDECSPLEREERKQWRRLWMGFDYYYELDAIREPHTSLRGSGYLNLRVRDVKRGKGGVSSLGSLKASEGEVECYSYPECTVKHDVAVQRGENVAYTDPLHAKAYGERGKNPGDVHSLDGRNVGTNVGEKGKLVDRAVQWRPQTRLLRLDGKNPGDVVRQKTGDEGFKGPLSTRQAPEPSEPNAFHELGKNPGDVFQARKQPYLGNNPHRMRLEKERYKPLNPERPDDLSHAKGKNPGDVVGYNSKYFEPHGQTIQGFIRSQSQLKERLKSREEAKRLFPDDAQKQQEYINFVHDHYSDPKGPNPRDVLKLDSVACPSGPQRWEREGTNRVQARFSEGGKNPGDVLKFKERSELRQDAHLGGNVGLAEFRDAARREGVAEGHLLGKNPGDVTKIGTHHGSSLSGEGRATHYEGQLVEAHPLGATPSDFWSVNTRPFKGAHFAVYPEAICVKPILSSCPENGVVLDPMAGSGTTCVVAKKLGRKWIGIELNPSYVEIAKKRLADLEKSADKKNMKSQDGEIGKSATLDSFSEKTS